MARLNRARQDDSDDDFPDLSQLLDTGNGGVKTPSRQLRKERCDTGTARATDQRSTPNRIVALYIIPSPSKSIAKASCAEEPVRKQRPLGFPNLTNSNSLLLPRPSGSLSYDQSFDHGKSTAEITEAVRSSPKRAAKVPINYGEFVEPWTDLEVSTSDDDSDTDLSGFIVSDSASGEENLPQTRSPKRHQHSLGVSDRRDRWNGEGLTTGSTSRRQGFVTIDLISPQKDRPGISQPTAHLPTSSPSKAKDKALNHSDLKEPLATLRYSPPRSGSPHKCSSTSRPVMPPSSPSKSKLKSPSKKARIPPTPHRPSIDAFWSQEVINDWNDQYSPKKTTKATRLNRLYLVGEDEEGEENISPSASPRRRPSKSPTKRDKAATERRKAFNEKKHELAISFIAEIDQTMTSGQVSKLSEPTGGINIIWSNKLSSTAGRANWHRETIRHRASDDTILSPAHRHHTSIELAEKVIDDENRLINTIAHEYCHLANFMISGIKDNPHGKEFKQWAAKCTRAFGDRGVEVTTKHSYTIAYKYIWACLNTECGLEYKRHSKSIDPTKHSCGKCKGKLVQTQPAPRGRGEGKVERSEYQKFVKREFELARKENPEKGWGEIMALLGKEFRDRKREAEREKELKGDDAKNPGDLNEGRDAKGDDVDEMLEVLDGLKL